MNTAEQIIKLTEEYGWALSTYHHQVALHGSNPHPLFEEDVRNSKKHLDNLRHKLHTHINQHVPAERDDDARN